MIRNNSVSEVWVPLMKFSFLKQMCMVADEGKEQRRQRERETRRRRDREREGK